MADATTAWVAYEQCQAILLKADLTPGERAWVTETLYEKYNALMTLEDDE